MVFVSLGAFSIFYFSEMIKHKIPIAEAGSYALMIGFHGEILIAYLSWFVFLFVFVKQLPVMRRYGRNEQEERPLYNLNDK